MKHALPLTLLVLTTLGLNATVIQKSICDGDSILAGGRYQKQEGTFYDTLKAGNGTDSVIVTYLTVNGNPKADFVCGNCEGCVPFPAYLAAKNSGGASSIFRWIHAVTHDTLSLDSSVDINFTHWGNYPLQIVVTSSAGCRSVSAIQVVHAHAVPHVDFDPDPPIATRSNPIFNFVNKSTTGDGAALSYKWSYPYHPAGSARVERYSTDTNLYNISYALDTLVGGIPVMLTTTSQYGCRDSITRQVYISPQGNGFADFYDAGIQVSLYPNPVQSNLTIHFVDKYTTGTILTVHDPIGRLVTKLPLTSDVTTLDVSKWVIGLYYVIIENKSGRARASFTKY